MDLKRVQELLGMNGGSEFQLMQRMASRPWTKADANGCYGNSKTKYRMPKNRRRVRNRMARRSRRINRMRAK